MALLFMDSFDHYVTADVTRKWTSYPTPGTGDVSGIAAVGRHSSNGWKMAATAGGGSGATRPLHKTLAPGDNTIVVGVAVTPVTPLSQLFNTTEPNNNGNAQAACLLLVRNANADQCWVRVNSNGTISVLRGTTVLGTSTAALSQGVATFIEILLTIHNTTGVVTIRFNGAVVLSLTAQNTRAGAANAWDEFRLGHIGASGFTTEWDVDDLYVLDGSGAAPWNAFLGDCRVDARYPTGAGATTGWAPSAGANWQCVDDPAPNDDTDYTGASAAGVTDTFVVQDAPVAGAAIYGVQACLAAKKTDAGAASIARVVRHSGVDYVGANLNPGTTYAMLLSIAATNPGTSAAWTEAGFNAAEFGYKRTV
jgi:hypothetical protein